MIWEVEMGLLDYYRVFQISNIEYLMLFCIRVQVLNFVLESKSTSDWLGRSSSETVIWETEMGLLYYYCVFEISNT